ncbi:MAG: c-type cytochrome [Pedosphaera sp.]|nr:c-type cytochrome [Pedosphaera sp.]
MNRHVERILCALAVSLASAAPAAQFKFATQTLTVPDGFEVEIAAGNDLAPRPIYGSFDEQGRLYVADSSGASGKAEEQKADPRHRILRLEDTDGDGKFDKTTVFADKMMFPEGCLWYDGSVYVAAPPSIWKLTDTNHDGIADAREVWHDGKTLTGCANDLHGPYLGPDGWIYWCKGAFAEQSYEVNGKPFKSRAAHIFRARPDHSRLEPVITGGMDNPVGLAWTPEGELILCGTFFAPGEPGHRDGLIHAIYGGVYGKPNEVLEGHKRTGDLMPVMTHMGPAAPAAVRRYESRAFGEEYRDNLFCCQFNLHKVSRHVLVPDGATFKTKDSDFLVSDNPDFHPTDVIEDADGSLLVLDTGAWYKICCPTSQLSKPDVLGAIYRVRRKGAPKVDDPRGLKLAWGKMKPDELAKLLGDERPAVAERTVQQLAKKGKAAVPPLADVLKKSTSPKTRRNAVWALTSIDHPKARESVRLALADKEQSVQHATLHSVGLWRDRGRFVAFRVLDCLVHNEKPQLQRAAAEALGRVGGQYSVAPLLEWMPGFVDESSNLSIGTSVSNTATATDNALRVMEHSLTFATIEIGDPAAMKLWTSVSRGTAPRIVRAVLIALDQMEKGGLEPEVVAPLLASTDTKLRRTAAWVAGHHPDWGGVLAGFFRERIAANNLNDSDRSELEKQLAQFVSNEAIQQVLVEALKNSSSPLVMRQMLLRVLAQPGLKEAPKGWPDAVRAALDAKDDALVRTAIPTAHALALVKTNAPTFAERLQKIARDTSRPDDLRLDALAALPRGLREVEPDLMSFLVANVAPAKSVAMRGAAAGALAKAKLSDEQLLTLADTLKAIGPMEVSRLLPAFDHKTNEAVGLRLVAALKESKGLAGVRPDALRSVATNYPPVVQQKADELLAALNVDAAKQKAHLDELQASWPAGDIRRGQLVFNSTKAACASCHKLGYLGGNVGPDLTAIGPARTERDLLESIVYPSASFVRSYEPFTIITKNDDEYSGVLRKDAPDEVVLATGPNTEVRVARSDITEMRPSRVSVMPAGLDQQITKQELADLVTFLKNTKWGAN